MSRRALNWLVLLIAYLINVVVVRTNPAIDSSYPLYLVLAEALGRTAFLAMPAFALQAWRRTPRVYHTWTVVVSLVLAASDFYRRSL